MPLTFCMAHLFAAASNISTIVKKNPRSVTANTGATDFYLKCYKSDPFSLNRIN